MRGGFLRAKATSINAVNWKKWKSRKGKKNCEFFCVDMKEEVKISLKCRIFTKNSQNFSV